MTTELPKPADRMSEVADVPREWREALRKLAFMATTSGGTAGPDAGLQAAIKQASDLLSMPYRYTTPSKPTAQVVTDEREEDTHSMQDLPGMWDQSDLMGGETDAVPDWRDLFWAISRVLGCLPSTNPGANQHVFRVARQAIALAAQPEPAKAGELLAD